MAEPVLAAAGRSTALRGACGYPYPRGACTGRVDAATAHVGICAACGGVWWVERKGRYQERRAEMLRIGEGVWAAAIHELVRELGAKQAAIDNLFAHQRAVFAGRRGRG